LIKIYLILYSDTLIFQSNHVKYSILFFEQQQSSKCLTGIIYNFNIELLLIKLLSIVILLVCNEWDTKFFKLLNISDYSTIR